jgi:L-ascorbate metabolism protein UlaG (beta-lactamase superfamily)
MNVTYYGHSCFGVEVGGAHLLFDPFITPNPLAREVDASRVPANYILLSHGHEDHVADAVAIARRTGARVLANYEICLWLSRQGLTNVVPMNLGGLTALEGLRVKLVVAHHSSMLPDGTNGGSAGGWVVETPAGNFYYSGDTALTLEMKLVAESTPLRWAALCLGDTFTMGVSDAIRAAGFLGCREILGVHYDTFPPILIDRAAAVARFKAAGLTLHLPGIGQTITL